jgi:hypothetical protein
VERDLEEPAPEQPPSPHLEPSQPPAAQTDIATALVGITEFLKSTIKPKAKSSTHLKDPEPFNGRDPKKLKQFLIQCAMHFNDRPEAFEDDHTRIVFAISNLHGDPFIHFSPIITQDEGSEVVQITTWDAFEDTLRSMFGPYDDSRDAEQELASLSMHHNSRISEYLVKFNTISTRLPKGWGEGALRHAFYTGLPERLKDDISRSPEGKPREFLRLRELAMQFDARYWERHAEVSRSQASKRAVVRTFDRPPVPIHNPRPLPNPPPRREEKKPFRLPNPTSQGSRPSNSHSSLASAHSRPPPSQNKLDKDGKITTKERQYRIDNGLCLYCGKSGHRVMNCKELAKANAAKAHAVSVPSASASGSGAKKETTPVSESKKD